VAVGTLAGAAWIQSHGAPAYYWDDQYPKGDYVYTNWTLTPRQVNEPTRWNSFVESCSSDTCDCPSGSETVVANIISAYNQSAGCLPFNPCNPSVLCIPPNGEGFPVGVTESFPDAGTFVIDEQYGSGWSAEFQQAMTDLLYQSPHVPATAEPCTPASLAWTEDGGGCSDDSDTAQFYPHRPLVEARLTVPSGAPALPSGVTIGWVSPVTDPDSPDALYPPNSNGESLEGTVPWAIWEAECACVSSAGRFDGVYGNQTVACP
jgi:hypothetical protein